MTDLDNTNEYNLTMNRGDTYKVDMEDTDSAGSPITLVGATFRFQLGGTSAAPTITESTSGVSITNGGALGTFSIVVSFTAMAVLDIGDHDHALEVTYADGVRRTLFTGTVTLIPDVRL